MKSRIVKDLHGISILCLLGLVTLVPSAGFGGPLKLVVNPYAKVDWKRVSQHRANLHTHTVEGGGEMFAEEVFKTYARRGYSIVAITDHDRCTHWQRWGFDPLKKYGVFPVMGQEYSKGNHVNGFFLDYRTRTAETQVLLGEIAGQGGVAVLNHPGRYWKEDASGEVPTATREAYLESIRQNQSVVGIEVINTRSRYPQDMLLWDRLLEVSMPDRPLWGYANDDAHSLGQVGYSWETFLLGEMNENTLRLAMKEGRFYLSKKRASDNEETQPPIIQSILHNEGAQQLSLVAAADGGKLPDTSYRWISKGRIICDGAVLDYGRTQGIGTYVRAEIIGKGGVSYTNPFGFSRSGY